MTEIIVLTLCAILNRLRGHSFTKHHIEKEQERRKQVKWRVWADRLSSRLVISAYVGWLATTYSLIKGSGWVDSSLYGLFFSSAFILWASFGWGRYYPFGKWNAKEEEFYPADIISNYIFNKSNNPYLAAGIGMTVRGLVALPLFIAVSIYLQNSLFIFLGLMLGLQGVLYYIAGRVCRPFYKDGQKISYRVELAEVLLGIIWGMIMIGSYAG